MQPPVKLAPEWPTTPPDHKQLPDEDGALSSLEQLVVPPDHKQLPDEDGTFVHNFQEHAQSNLLTECLLPRLRELVPDGQFCIGCDSGIYWRVTNPVLEGCKAPDWFLVVGVPPMLDGELRRSYVLWRESIRPLLVVEFVSGDGSEERDATPFRGKFWVYEQAICAAYYAIYEVEKASVEVHRLEAGRYRPVAADERGRFLIEPLGVALGLQEGEYRGMRLPWLRAWDANTGNLLPLSEERADTAEGLLDDARRRLDDETERAEGERKRADEQAREAEAARKRADEQAREAEAAHQRADEQAREAEAARQRAERLAARLRELGVAPEDV